jgi:hypothetical protein
MKLANTVMLIYLSFYSLTFKINKKLIQTNYCDDDAHQYCEGGMVCRWYSCYSPYDEFQCLSNSECQENYLCDLGSCIEYTQK